MAETAATPKPCRSPLDEACGPSKPAAALPRGRPASRSCGSPLPLPRRACTPRMPCTRSSAVEEGRGAGQGDGHVAVDPRFACRCARLFFTIFRSDCDLTPRLLSRAWSASRRWQPHHPPSAPRHVSTRITRRWPRLRCSRVSPTRFSLTGADSNFRARRERPGAPRRQAKNAVRYHAQDWDCSPARPGGAVS